MQFLVFTSPTDAAVARPPPATDFARQTAWFQARLAEGVIANAWHGEGHAVFVFNAASRGALDASIGSIPLAEQMEVRVEP
jgi:hypothetical protein